MISYDDALGLISSKVKKLDKVTIPLADALGFHLAQPIKADRPYPPYNRAAMDGIAIRFQDFLNGIETYEIQEIIYAGDESKGALANGCCYKIMTGAAVPSSADTIVRNEDILFSGNKAHIIDTKTLKRNKNIAAEGQDLQLGELAVPHNSSITPSIVSLLATIGIHRPLVFRKPKVSVFTTGNEIVSPETQPSTVQIRNSNQFLLTALLAKDGIIPEAVKHIKDTEEDLLACLPPYINNDILIINGGVSAGERDLVPAVMKRLGAASLFHHVAIKPGKPLWCGKLPSGCLVFGVPGNPFSCLTTYTLFIKPILRFNASPPIEYPMACAREKRSKFDEFFPVRFSSNGKLEPIAMNGSGDVRLGLFADGIARHHYAFGNLKTDDLISFYAF